MQYEGQAGAVTPEGVRAGDADALAALVDRRGAAVLAYCREVCDAAQAPLAAAEALARFRAAVWAAGDATDLDPERLLLSATRHAAAARAQAPADGPGATRRILGRTGSETCARMPSLIVARAENLLGSADLDRLSRHLERCHSCRSTEAAFRRAERAYVATTHAPVDDATTALLVGALGDAAPLEHEIETTHPAPEPEPLVAEPEPVGEPTLPHETVLADEPEAVGELVPDELDDLDDDGWTGEDEAVTEPEPVPLEESYDHHMIEPGPATWNASEEPSKRRRLRIVIPVVVVGAGAAAALAIAGVFDSGGSSSPDTQSVNSTSSTPARTSTTAHRHKHTATNPTTGTATP